MKIIAISDTHSLENLVPVLPLADVLVFAGDLMNSGTKFSDIVNFNQWLDKLPIPKENRLIGLGNHDILFDETHPSSNKKFSEIAKSLITNGRLLVDEEVIIDGVKFFGSPWTPRFFDWGFNADRGEEIKKHWNKIPNDVNVLVTHGPPFGVLDKTVSDVNHLHLGCEELSKRIRSLTKLKHHVFGHIHGSRGQHTVTYGPMIKELSTVLTYTNASFLNEQYRPHKGLGYFILEV